MTTGRGEDPEDMSCAGKRCRKVVEIGQGIQVVGKDGDAKRYCGRCYGRILKEEERHEATRTPPHHEGA